MLWLLLLLLLRGKHGLARKVRRTGWILLLLAGGRRTLLLLGIPLSLGHAVLVGITLRGAGRGRWLGGTPLLRRSSTRREALSHLGRLRGVGVPLAASSVGRSASAGGGGHLGGVAAVGRNVLLLCTAHRAAGVALVPEVGRGAGRVLSSHGRVVAARLAPGLTLLLHPSLSHLSSPIHLAGCASPGITWVLLLLPAWSSPWRRHHPSGSAGAAIARRHPGSGAAHLPRIGRRPITVATIGRLLLLLGSASGRHAPVLLLPIVVASGHLLTWWEAVVTRILLSSTLIHGRQRLLLLLRALLLLSILIPFSGCSASTSKVAQSVQAREILAKEVGEVLHGRRERECDLRLCTRGQRSFRESGVESGKEKGGIKTWPDTATSI